MPPHRQQSAGSNRAVSWARSHDGSHCRHRSSGWSSLQSAVPPAPPRRGCLPHHLTMIESAKGLDQVQSTSAADLSTPGGRISRTRSRCSRGITAARSSPLRHDHRPAPATTWVSTAATPGPPAVRPLGPVPPASKPRSCSLLPRVSTLCRPRTVTNCPMPILPRIPPARRSIVEVRTCPTQGTHGVVPFGAVRPPPTRYSGCGTFKAVSSQ